MVAPFLRPDGDLSPTEQRAAIAALAGPLLIPFAAHRPITIPATATGQGLRFSTNGTGDTILYVELRAISGAPGDTVLIGDNANLQNESAPAFVFPTESPARFLLFPGRSLYVRSTLGGGTRLLVLEVAV